MLSVIYKHYALSVVMLNVVMLSVIARHLYKVLFMQSIVYAEHRDYYCYAECH